MRFIFIICKTVAGISITSQFHEFCEKSFWRVFVIWPMLDGAFVHTATELARGAERIDATWEFHHVYIHEFFSHQFTKNTLRNETFKY